MENRTFIEDKVITGLVFEQGVSHFNKLRSKTPLKVDALYNMFINKGDLSGVNFYIS